MSAAKHTPGQMCPCSVCSPPDESCGCNGTGIHKGFARSRFCTIDKPARPHVGMPATYSIGSDDYGGQILTVSKTGHRVTWASVGSIRHVKEFTRRTDGTYRCIGSKYGYLTLGVSETRLDPGF